MENKYTKSFSDAFKIYLETFPIVPQLSKCLKFETVWGVLTDQLIRI